MVTSTISNEKGKLEANDKNLFHRTLSCKKGNFKRNIMMDNIFLLSEKVGNVDPKLYRSISLDSYDFTTLSDDYMGKIYFQVSFKGVPLNKMLYL